MLSKVRNTISRHLLNLPGWRTNRKIVVIESDDWGSIRMPSKSVFQKMLKLGVPVDKCPYNRYDSLESETDLQELFEVLLGFKDINGKHPIITANTVVANPDFEKIKESGFNQYYYEPFTETLKKYPEHNNSFDFWKKGITEGVLYPQYHGREHVNVHLWLHLLQKKMKEFVLAFENGFWGLGPNVVNNPPIIHIQAALDYSQPEEMGFQKESIKDGLNLFENIFGYRPKTFIANNFVWDAALNETLKNSGICSFQGMKYQLLPYGQGEKRKKIRHYLGEKNDLNQLFLVRNCHFEPSNNNHFNSVDSCLKDISSAFFWKKPAIISSHRLNFIGFINQANRENNLIQLKNLLHGIQKKWPTVVFLTSEELVSAILEGTHANEH